MLHLARLIERHFQGRPLHPATLWLAAGSALLLCAGFALLLVR